MTAYEVLEAAKIADKATFGTFNTKATDYRAQQAAMRAKWAAGAAAREQAKREKAEREKKEAEEAAALAAAQQREKDEQEARDRAHAASLRAAEAEKEKKIDEAQECWRRLFVDNLDVDIRGPISFAVISAAFDADTSVFTDRNDLSLTTYAKGCYHIAYGGSLSAQEVYQSLPQDATVGMIQTKRLARGLTSQHVIEAPAGLYVNWTDTVQAAAESEWYTTENVHELVKALRKVKFGYAKERGKGLTLLDDITESPQPVAQDVRFPYPGRYVALGLGKWSEHWTSLRTALTYRLDNDREQNNGGREGRQDTDPRDKDSYEKSRLLYFETLKNITDDLSRNEGVWTQGTFERKFDLIWYKSKEGVGSPPLSSATPTGVGVLIRKSNAGIKSLGSDDLEDPGDEEDEDTDFGGEGSGQGKKSKMKGQPSSTQS